MRKKSGLGLTVDLILYRNRKKKLGFGANGGFDFTKELKEKLRKNMGFGTNGGFALQRKRKNS